MFKSDLTLDEKWPLHIFRSLPSVAVLPLTVLAAAAFLLRSRRFAGGSLYLIALRRQHPCGVLYKGGNGTVVTLTAAAAPAVAICTSSAVAVCTSLLVALCTSSPSTAVAADLSPSSALSCRISDQPPSRRLVGYQPRRANVPPAPPPLLISRATGVHSRSRIPLYIDNAPSSTPNPTKMRISTAQSSSCNWAQICRRRVKIRKKYFCTTMQ